MLPSRTIAALAAGALLTWGSAQAAPETPEATQEIPVIILELGPPSPDAGGAASAAEVDQAIMTMLLMQLLMGLQPEGETPEAAPVAAPSAGVQRI